DGIRDLIVTGVQTCALPIFQHEVLKRFHDQVRAGGKRWRDLTPSEARERVGRIASALTEDYRDGLLRDTEQSRFTAQMLTESLQDRKSTRLNSSHDQISYAV